MAKWKVSERHVHLLVIAITAVPLAPFAPRVFDQDAPHCFCDSAEKMPSTVELLVAD
jgi:hypothetical protein